MQDGFLRAITAFYDNGTLFYKGYTRLMDKNLYINALIVEYLVRGTTKLDGNQIL